MTEFKLELSTPRVSVDRSYVVGDRYVCGNDEAYIMLANNMATLVGNTFPRPPIVTPDSPVSPVAGGEIAQPANNEPQPMTLPFGGEIAQPANEPAGGEIAQPANEPASENHKIKHKKGKTK